MRHLLLLSLCLAACSSSTDPTPTGDAGTTDAGVDAAAFEGGVCGPTGATCGDTISTPCCSMACVIGPLGDFTCQ